MLSLGVNVIISSGINSLWVSVYKRIVAFSHNGHKAFTWWYETPVGNTVYQEPHCQHTTMIPYIWKRAHGYDRYLPTLRTDKRTIVRLLRYAPNYANVAYCVPRHEFWATHCILQPFLTCWLVQNLTGCTLHPRGRVGRCRCENGILVICLQILHTNLINGCKMHCVTWSMIQAFTSLVQIICWADTGPGKRLHVVFLCGRVIYGSPTAITGKAT